MRPQGYLAPVGATHAFDVGAPSVRLGPSAATSCTTMASRSSATSSAGLAPGAVRAPVSASHFAQPARQRSYDGSERGSLVSPSVESESGTASAPKLSLAAAWASSWEWSKCAAMAAARRKARVGWSACKCARRGVQIAVEARGGARVWSAGTRFLKGNVQWMFTVNAVL